MMRTFTSIAFLVISLGLFGQSSALTSSNAMHFAYGDYVELTSMPPLTDQYTLMAWINPTNTSRNAIGGWGHSSAYASTSFLRISGGVLQTVQVNTAINGTTTINTGEWVHVALTRDGNDFKLYVNGVLDKSDTQPATTTTTDFNVGCFTYFGDEKLDYFIGKMDEFALWNSTLTASQISSYMESGMTGSEAGLVIYYPFEDGTANEDNTGLTELANSVSASYPGPLTGFALTGSTGNFTNWSDPQTISFPALEDKTYGDADFSLSATASSGLDISYSSSDEGVATVSGNTVHLTGAGSVTIFADQEGNANYIAAPQESQSFSVAAKELGITATANNKVYDGTTIASISDAALTGVVEGDEVSLTDATVGAFATADAGTAIVVTTNSGIAGADEANYTLVQATLSADITPKELIFAATAEDKVYDGTTIATLSGAIAEGIVEGDDVILTDTSVGTFASKDVGTDIEVTTAAGITGADEANYILTQSLLSADIAAKELIIEATAEDKVYDGTSDATITGASLSGVVEGEDVSLTNATTGTFASADVGTDIAVTMDAGIAGADEANYSLTQTSLTADITVRPIEITADDATKAEGADDPVFTYAITDGNLVGDDEISGALSREAGEDAGTYEIQLGTLVITDNYEIAFVAGTFTITSTVGIINNSAMEFYLFPNPTIGHLTISFEKEMDYLSIFSLTGKTVLERHIAGLQQVELNLENLPSGLYMVQVKAGGQHYTKKILKN